MKIPKHIAELADALRKYIQEACNHEDYVNHGSPPGGTEIALQRVAEARLAFDAALGRCVDAEHVRAGPSTAHCPITTCRDSGTCVSGARGHCTLRRG